MSRKVTLVLTLTKGIEAEDIVTDINAEILCRLQEDEKRITTWKWSY